MWMWPWLLEWLGRFYEESQMWGDGAIPRWFEDWLNAAWRLNHQPKGREHGPGLSVTGRAYACRLRLPDGRRNGLGRLKCARWSAAPGQLTNAGSTATPGTREQPHDERSAERRQARHPAPVV